MEVSLSLSKKSVKSYEAVELSNKQRNYLSKKFKIKTYPTITQWKNMILLLSFQY